MLVNPDSRAEPWRALSHSNHKRIWQESSGRGVFPGRSPAAAGSDKEARLALRQACARVSPATICSMPAIYLAPWRIDITVREGVPRLVPAAALARAIRTALEVAGAPAPASVGLILSDDHELTRLNRAAMAKDGPTDVLSFPLLPPAAYPPHAGQDPAARRASAVPAFVLPPGRRPHLGEIVVSVERAVAQAEAGRGGQTGDVHGSAADELRLLVTHGALHLCGWDHAEPAEEAAMRALERRLLTSPRTGALQRRGRARSRSPGRRGSRSA